MKSLSISDSNQLLAAIGMRIGDWNQVAPIDRTQADLVHRTSFTAPRESSELFCLAFHAAGWLPSGRWKLLQIDNSNYFNVVDRSLLSQLLFGTQWRCNLNAPECSSFLFEYADRADANQKSDLLISHLIYSLLLVEGHAYLVSAASKYQELLAIQDGAVHFSSLQTDVSGAAAALARFKENPSNYPRWVADAMAQDQDRPVM
ncbi:hypothetical protein [Peristeroidobacter soli]|jgi:hypothetical protein|uniref:hypothetical protein n=1 Tax=Peristeroidobacter soli TaxID=2497877 RepID=UPI00101C45EB|nr:hypothetical protein [Peristeroidobacter soli]